MRKTIFLEATSKDFVHLFSSLVYKVVEAYSSKQALVPGVRCPVVKISTSSIIGVFSLNGKFH